MPPQKELEDWSGSFPTKSLAKESWQEKAANSSSSRPSQFSANSSRFSFNGIDKLSFALNRGEKPQWEVAVSPIEFYKIWDSGAWTGLSLGTREFHHFYVRAHRRGPEPKYRTYGLNSKKSTIDFTFCSKKDALLLEKEIQAKTEDIQVYSITHIKMLSSQELKREAAWDFEAEPGQEYLSFSSNNCKTVELEGWPKSHLIHL